jgi:sec-independent protein translocase protein TatB
MFGIGMSEMIIICVVALLVFGPDELPQIVKKIARGVGEARKVTDDLRRSIDLVDDDEEDRRARTFARTQPQQTSLTASKPTEPEVIPGSALTPAHGDDAPVIASPAGAVAVGADDVDVDEDAARHEGDKPSTPMTEPTAATTSTPAHGLDGNPERASPATGR